MVCFPSATFYWLKILAKEEDSVTHENSGRFRSQRPRIKSCVNPATAPSYVSVLGTIYTTEQSPESLKHRPLRLAKQTNKQTIRQPLDRHTECVWGPFPGRGPGRWRRWPKAGGKAERATPGRPAYRSITPRPISVGDCEGRGARRAGGRRGEPDSLTDGQPARARGKPSIPRKAAAGRGQHAGGGAGPAWLCGDPGPRPVAAAAPLSTGPGGAGMRQQEGLLRDPALPGAPASIRLPRAQPGSCPHLAGVAAASANRELGVSAARAAGERPPPPPPGARGGEGRGVRGLVCCLRQGCVCCPRPPPGARHSARPLARRRLPARPPASGLEHLPPCAAPAHRPAPRLRVPPEAGAPSATELSPPM